MTSSSKAAFALDLPSLRNLYRSGESKPSEIVRLVYRRIAADASNPIWITLRPQAEALEDARRLETHEVDASPLYGVPFAVKDNIDVAGLSTTVAYSARTKIAEADAAVVARLRAAGAIPIGKTNLDQFATGLTGARSDFGVCLNAFDRDYISGGSSSGSAVAVAAGHVSFALGTDTAGSGRVPAAFNNIVGLKPTRGLISTRGVAPACRSIDCVSIFASTCRDAGTVFAATAEYDDGDPFSRGWRMQTAPRNSALRVGILAEKDAEFFGDRDARELYAGAIERLRASGARTVEIDFSAFRSAGELLYEGPWLAERLMTLKELAGTDAAWHGINPVVRKVVAPGANYSAADVFEGFYRLRTFTRRADHEWEKADLIALPTTASIFTVREVQADPIETNRRLGLYTNFVNLLDLCAIAVPAAFRSNGLPFGISLIAPRMHDEWLCSIGARYEEAEEPATADQSTV